MNKYFYIFIVLGLFASACKTTSAESKRTTKSGYDFEVVRNGSEGDIKPGDFVEFNMDVLDLDGQVKFSSADVDQPAILNIPASDDIPPQNPIIEMIGMSKIGDSLVVMATPEMMGPAAGTDTVIYHLGIFAAMDSTAYEARMAADQAAIAEKMAEAQAAESVIAEKVAGIYNGLNSAETKSKMKTTATGLKYMILEEGNGPLPELGKQVFVNYYGVLASNGEMFDNSWKRGRPIDFPLGGGRVIKGWDEGVALLPKGSKAVLLIPPSLGYGEQDNGPIKGNSELLFYIEVQE